MHLNHKYFWRAYKLNKYIPKICMHLLLRPLLTKEQATKDKGKRGRKRKGPAPEAGEPEPKTKVARMIAED